MPDAIGGAGAVPELPGDPETEGATEVPLARSGIAEVARGAAAAALEARRIDAGGAPGSRPMSVAAARAALEERLRGTEALAQAGGSLGLALARAEGVDPIGELGEDAIRALPGLEPAARDPLLQLVRREGPLPYLDADARALLARQPDAAARRALIALDGRGPGGLEDGSIRPQEVLSGLEGAGGAEAARLERAFVDALHRPWVERPPVRPSSLHAAPVEEIRNDARTWSFTPRAAYRPESLRELSDLMRLASDEGRRLKPIGSLHSSSKAPVADDILVHPEGLSFVEGPGEVAMRGELREGLSMQHLVRVGSGTQLRTINPTLWEEHGLALPNMGGYDEQTIAGAIATATHGSGLQFGPLSDMVRSMDMVLPGGRTVRIERADGPTEPEAFRRLHPDMELLQDDALFQSAVVSMGSMGVVHSYILEVRDAFHLDEQRTVHTWDEVKRDLLANGGVRRLMPGPGEAEADGERFPARHVELVLNPYAVDGERTAIVTTRKEVEAEELPGGGFKNRNLVERLFHGEHARPALAEAGLDLAANPLTQLSRWLSESFPSRAPGLLDGSLRSIADEQYVERSYNVFNIGAANDVDAYAAEIALPLEGDRYVEALDALLAQAERFRAEGKVHTGPLAVRFVRASDATLAPQQEDVAMVEIIFTRGSEHAQEMLETYQRLLAEYGGRPHFGQMHALDRDGVEALYGPERLETFSRARRLLDPDGVMKSPFTRETLDR